MLALSSTLFFGQVPAQSAGLLELSHETTSNVPSQLHLSMYEDPSDQVSIDTMIQDYATLFKPIDGDVVEAGHTASSIWAHFSVQDSSSEVGAKTWLLEVDYAMLKRVDVYVVDKNKAVQRYNIGYENPIANRALPYRSFLQPISLVSGETYDIFINAKRTNGNVKIPIKWHKPIDFLASEIAGNYVFGLIFGIMLAMVIYNTFVYLSVGERVYLYYILYIIFCVTAVLAITGFGNLFIWGNFPAVNHYVISISACLAAISALLFTRHFIRQEYYSNKLDTFIRMFVWVGAGLIVYKIISGQYLGIPVAVYIGTLCSIAPFSLFYSWRKGSRSAGFFLLSWSVFLIGQMVYLLAFTDVIPSNAFTQNGVLLGAAGEMLLLSWGLADRINRAKRAQYFALQEKHEATLQLKEAEDRLMHRALHSGSTGLPNHTFMKSVLESLIDSDKNAQFSLFVFNLDNFHEINKTLGHSNGSKVLDAFVNRLKPLCATIPNSQRLETTNTEAIHVGLIEGMTFGVLINELNFEKLHRYGAQLVSEIEKPFEYEELYLNIDVSVGVALYPCHGESSDELLRNAQIALEAAKNTSQKLAIYSQKIDPYNERRISLVGSLKKALENDELELYFQPQIDLTTSKIAGFEALLRWFHPDYGFIPPDEFIPLAERTGVIQLLTCWVARKAFAMKHKLDKKGINVAMSINISARNLADPKFKDQMCEIAIEQEINLNEVVMELTETALMSDAEAARNVMNQLHQEGVRWSIDDFGTGHASLSYIRKLPVHEIKIDRSFVMDMVRNHDDQVIVNTTLLMGHNLNLRVVAEGIEDEPTLLKLRDMGCDLVQGYHIGRPMDEHKLLLWIPEYQRETLTFEVIKGSKL